METVRIKTPATVANLVCGFDVLGMCLHEPYDEMEIRRLLDEKKGGDKKCGWLPIA
jgi:homoserine kinase